MKENNVRNTEPSQPGTLIRTAEHAIGTGVKKNRMNSNMDSDPETKRRVRQEGTWCGEKLDSNLADVQKMMAGKHSPSLSVRWVLYVRSFSLAAYDEQLCHSTCHLLTPQILFTYSWHEVASMLMPFLVDIHQSFPQKNEQGFYRVLLWDRSSRGIRFKSVHCHSVLHTEPRPSGWTEQDFWGDWTFKPVLVWCFWQTAGPCR